MLADIKDLIEELGWEYDRLSLSGQETYNKLCELLKINE
jgi:hypothetical protein